MDTRKPTMDDWPVIYKQAAEFAAAKNEVVQKCLERDGFFFDPVLNMCIVQTIPLKENCNG